MKIFLQTSPNVPWGWGVGTITFDWEPLFYLVFWWVPGTFLKTLRVLNYLFIPTERWETEAQVQKLKHREIKYLSGGDTAFWAEPGQQAGLGSKVEASPLLSVAWGDHGVGLIELFDTFSDSKTVHAIAIGVAVVTQEHSSSILQGKAFSHEFRASPTTPPACASGDRRRQQPCWTSLSSC